MTALTFILGIYTVSVVIGFAVYNRQTEINEGKLAVKLAEAITAIEKVAELRQEMSRLNALVTDHESKLTSLNLKVGLKGV